MDSESRTPDSGLRPAVHLRDLPTLPRTIRYLDEFTNQWRTLALDPSKQIWQLRANARSLDIVFPFSDPDLNDVIRHWVVWMLGHLSVVTVYVYSRSLAALVARLGEADAIGPLFFQALEIERIWYSELKPSLSVFDARAFKSLLKFACHASIGHLRPGHDSFVGALSLPKRDVYAVVRSGKALLSNFEEAGVIGLLDNVNHGLTASHRAPLSNEELRDACILCISFQYAMRPIQIAGVRSSDVRIFETGDDSAPHAVHITFLRAKQRRDGARLPTVRKIKREWCPMFVSWSRRRHASSAATDTSDELRDFFFGLAPNDITPRLRKLTKEINGTSRTANHLRHNAAQRLVDAGASQEELAEFMTHSSAQTGLVYFEASPTQADRVNKALAISPTYSDVAKIASSGMIDIESLRGRPFDQQIGGVPHGIPIAGIGACDLGQSLCPRNPVTSCYTCPKFLPLAESSIHDEVLRSLRPIVHQFEKTSRGEDASPAFMQLRQTLAAVSDVIQVIQKREGNES